MEAKINAGNTKHAQATLNIMKASLKPPEYFIRMHIKKTKSYTKILYILLSWYCFHTLESLKIFKYIKNESQISPRMNQLKIQLLIKFSFTVGN